MTSTSPANIAMQDNLDDATGALSTPLGTEHIPPVRPAPVNTPTQPEINAVTLSQAAANQQPEKIMPAWVYFPIATAAGACVLCLVKYFS